MTKKDYANKVDQMCKWLTDNMNEFEFNDSMGNEHTGVMGTVIYTSVSEFVNAFKEDALKK